MLRKLLLILMVLGLPGIAAAAPVVMVLGDSLSAGYGIDQNDTWVNLLAQRLNSENRDFAVVNASVSGATTSDGLSRLERELDRHRPAIVVIELGGNDGLRGLSLAQMRTNLARIIETVQASGARVVLAGMRLPPNYGPDYTRRFHQVYSELAARYDVALIPFLLQGLDDTPAYFQADGIHPTAAAQSVILSNVWPHLAPLLPAK